jgi:Meckel syndrome type 1 protein
MKLSCTTCQARYNLADEKVVGRIVKIRCRKCGAIIVAEGAPPQEDEPTTVTPVPTGLRTGQRNEESVLFSLSALDARLPATPSPRDESSGLIDLQTLTAAMQRPEPRPSAVDEIAALGSGAPFLPALAPPIDVPLEPEPRRRPPTVWAVAVGAALLLSLPVLARSVPRDASRPQPVSPAAPSAPSASPEARVTDEGPQARPTEAPPAPVATTASLPRRTAVAVVASSAPTGHPAVPPAETSRCCPGESETTCAMRLSVGGACGPAVATAVRAFEPAEAGRALGAVAFHGCGAAGASGHARVTFEPTGAVSAVVVDTAELASTPAERCVTDAYRRVHVRAFAGPAVTVGKRFTLP